MTDKPRVFSRCGLQYYSFNVSNPDGTEKKYLNVQTAEVHYRTLKNLYSLYSFYKMYGFLFLHWCESHLAILNDKM